MIYQIGWQHISDCCKLVYEQAVRCLHRDSQSLLSLFWFTNTIKIISINDFS